MVRLVVDKTPEPGSDEMVTLLNDVLHAALGQLSPSLHFTAGDVMGAAMYILVDAGLEASSPAVLRGDIIIALDRMLADWAKTQGSMH